MAVRVKYITVGDVKKMLRGIPALTPVFIGDDVLDGITPVLHVVRQLNSKGAVVAIEIQGALESILTDDDDDDDDDVPELTEEEERELAEKLSKESGGIVAEEVVKALQQARLAMGDNTSCEQVDLCHWFENYEEVDCVSANKPFLATA